MERNSEYHKGKHTADTVIIGQDQYDKLAEILESEKNKYIAPKHQNDFIKDKIKQRRNRR